MFGLKSKKDLLFISQVRFFFVIVVEKEIDETDKHTLVGVIQKEWDFPHRKTTRAKPRLIEYYIMKPTLHKEYALAN